MKPSHGRRTWIKLWTVDWLEGTTRYQMSDAQRAFWVDLLAMAGRSRFGGVVCSGKDGDQWIGYPLSKFQGLLAEPIDVEATFELFRRTGKITIEVAGEGTRKLYTLFISNWAHYQSEYERKRGEKKRRSANVPPDVPKKSAGMSPSMSLESTSTEVEADGEVEGEERRRKATAAAAFTSLGFEAPFGHARFQSVWVRRFSTKKPDEWLTQVMEQTIQECQAADIGIPPQFYEAKRDVEAREKLDFQNRAQ